MTSNPAFIAHQSSDYNREAMPVSDFLKNVRSLGEKPVVQKIGMALIVGSMVASMFFSNKQSTTDKTASEKSPTAKTAFTPQ